jgi:hypothetical protein
VICSKVAHRTAELQFGGEQFIGEKLSHLNREPAKKPHMF